MRKAAGLTALVMFVGLFLSTAWPSDIDGIWKDAPKDQAGARFSVYLQTYVTGSAVAVLSDGAGSPIRLYAFLAPDYPNGFHADEIGGANAALTIEDPGSLGTAAQIRLGDKTESIFLYPWFRAAAGGEDSLPDDGIFKDEPPTEATTFNLFFQTYPTDESAVAVITRDGGATYYAFLQSGFSGSFDVDDLLGKGAHLNAAIDSAGLSSFTLTPPEGSPSAGSLYRWFQAPVTANTYDLEGTVRYNGAPLSEQTPALPLFRVRNIETGVPADQVVGAYEDFSSAYTLSNVPGRSDIWISVIMNGDYDTLPGNFVSSTVVTAEELTPAERQAYDFNVWQVIQLTEPYDNAQTTPARDEYPVHAQPVVFEWVPIAEADGYEVLIDRMRSANHSEGYGRIETVIDEETAAAHYAPMLDLSQPDEHYEFVVYARNGSLLVGQSFVTFADDGSSGRYGFRVVSP
ncbi:MAG: hypothetical protein HY788_15850 [Deltaproteobacteria bacterium]|nr:hypothetical protein [Deltaproteobacteria bacterium]